MPRFAVSLLALVVLSGLVQGRAAGAVLAEMAVPFATYLTIADQPDKLTDHWTAELPRGTARHAMDEAVAKAIPPSSPLFEFKHQDEEEANPPPSVIFKVHPAQNLPAEHDDVTLVQPATGPALLPYLVGIGVAGGVLGIGLLVQLLRRG
jgi:hypothetical protein